MPTTSECSPRTRHGAAWRLAAADAWLDTGLFFCGQRTVLAPNAVSGRFCAGRRARYQGRVGAAEPSDHHADSDTYQGVSG
jgi:hypothetical protein